MAPRVRAVLGPTNTGKTHLALTRLLAHGSGIAGFPLRLLARENYERMVAAKGERQVALITGEEKIVPPDARYFACTTEAMPLDRAVEFLAVDEIQLCADPDRGHVFTSRLLHARGLVETMFLGAETIRPLIARLVPGIEIETRPRLSQLTFSGAAKLTKLPPRTAVVAFSAAEVYLIAEMIRRRRGGCAVVMGRLSPRTRNAQVALYQEGEVDFLVATDAIGMGLNMDVNHVAFAALGKFDGSRARRLTPAEIAQIAGRAGRGMRDGTFGTTGASPAMPEDVVEAIEAHRFDPLETLFWREDKLDFASVSALLDSLQAPPPVRGLARGNDAADLQTLAALANDPEVVRVATVPARVRLLWEACQVPDFRKITDDSHIRLCARVFLQLATGAKLPDAWLEAAFDAVDRTDGDLDTLMARLSGVRVWSYIAARADWVADAEAWAGRARAVEDRLSDALHERLTARFVDRRAAHLLRRLEESVNDQDLLSAVTASGEVVVEGHAVGRIEGFAFEPDVTAQGPERALVLRAARRALREEMPRRVAILEADPDASFQWTDDGRLTWRGAAIARLAPGRTLLRPEVQVLASEFIDGAQRERIRRRLAAYVEGAIAAVFGPLLSAEKAVPDAVPALRGPLHLLVEDGGVLAPCPEVSAAARAVLKAHHLRAGRFALYVPALLKPRAAQLRARLYAIRHGRALGPLPEPGRVTLGAGALTPEAAAFLGWVAAGPLYLRLDIAERLAAELAWSTRHRPGPIPADLPARLGIKAETVPIVLRALGFRLLPAPALDPGAFGPPAPPSLVPVRKRPGRAAAAAAPRAAAAVSPDHPFAILATLRR